MADIDHGIAGALGAAFAGAVVAAKELVDRRRRPDVEARIAWLEREAKEARAMVDKIDERLDAIEQGLQEVAIARARTDELLPVIREELRELREDIRTTRGKGTPR